ncbi:MAG: hypothetical protein IJB84_02635 [Lachnospiraceae bacterium]|nr:hypothetical protein [Lachnospiraceae bacterium]
MSKFEELAYKWGLEMAPFMAVDLLPDKIMEEYIPAMETMVNERVKIGAKILMKRCIKDSIKRLLADGKLTSEEIVEYFDFSPEQIQGLINQ